MQEEKKIPISDSVKLLIVWPLLKPFTEEILNFNFFAAKPTYSFSSSSSSSSSTFLPVYTISFLPQAAISRQVGLFWKSLERESNSSST